MMGFVFSSLMSGLINSAVLKRIAFILIIFGGSQTLAENVNDWSSTYSLRKGLTSYCPETLQLTGNEEAIEIQAEYLSVKAVANRKSWDITWNYRTCEVNTQAKLFDEAQFSETGNFEQFPVMVFVSTDKAGECEGSQTDRRFQMNFFTPDADDDLQIIMTGVAYSAIACWYTKGE